MTKIVKYHIIKKVNYCIIIVQGYEVIIDDFLCDKIIAFNWHIKKKSDNDCYVGRERKKSDDYHARTILLHRFLLNAKRGQVVDHINGNTLDNRISNLRIITHSGNCTNRRKSPLQTNKKSSSKYKGVSKRYKVSGEIVWQACIRKDKFMYLGKYNTEIEAAQAYNEAAIKYHGEFARLNKLPCL